jgi:hypothetical protein
VEVKKMSVIMEAQTGDPIVFIIEVVGCEDGVPFNWESSKEFKIGDIVYYLDFYKDENEPQEYLAWCIKFKDANGRTYSATQTLLVTMDEWNDLSNHFKGDLK